MTFTYIENTSICFFCQLLTEQLLSKTIAETNKILPKDDFWNDRAAAHNYVKRFDDWWVISYELIPVCISLYGECENA